MRRRREHGAALMTVLMFMTMILVVTIAVMGIMRADLAAGIRQQQAVQVFNVAEAGIHYAIARLQLAGAVTYGGETRAILDGLSVVGQAVITVRCLDGSLPSVNSCAGATAAYRRVTATGTLPVPGPVRMLTAIVEGTTSSTGTYAVCGYDGVNFDRGVRVYGNVGTNGNLTLAAGADPSRICDSTPGGGGGACTGPAAPPAQAYSGSAYAVGTITCGGGACTSNSIEGTIAPNQPAGSVCPTVTLTPPSGPGVTNLTVPVATTVTVDPATNYGAVTLASNPGGCPADLTQRATLVIDSGSDATATVTVRMRTLWIGRCARVVITGVGKVVLWLLEPAAPLPTDANQALKAEQQAIFGSMSLAGPDVPIGGDRFTINVVSNKPLDEAGGCVDGGAICSAVDFNQSGLVSGTFVIPDGGYALDQAQLTNGAILARRIQFDRDTRFTWDPLSSLGSNAYANFNRLKSWKDQ
jgi:hypothetical protein